ncbi:MAG: FAD-dependent oxidoreductase [Oligoflexales bacterium]|nr:FAD-dependent oxidoreductase [Oligoflexales bacterium]
MGDNYDIIIVGAGLAGVLTAVRICDADRALKILLVEKDETIGGRLRSSSKENNSWNYGLGQLSCHLYEFLDQTLRTDPESKDLPFFTKGEIKTFGLLSAGKISSIEAKDLFGREGAYLIAGSPAVRDWDNVDILFQADEGNKKLDQTFINSWPGNKKSPAALVLDHIYRIWGVPEIWKANTRNMIELARLSKNPVYRGLWQNALLEALGRESIKDRLTIKTRCRVVSSSFSNGQWTLTSEQGAVRAGRIIAAQSPWDLMNWLSKEHIPHPVLSLISKTKPISAVILSEYLSPGHNLPDVVLVPSEDTQIIINSENEIAYQATLDYELTLQAPEVIKAIKKLKRARAKLLKAFPNITSEGGHIALIPVSWGTPVAHSEKRWTEKLDYEKLNTKNISFCGDAYGKSIDGDRNIIDSVRETVKCALS